MTRKERGLGKGIDALFSHDIEEQDGQILEISLDEIDPCLKQPRKTFDESSLRELADSIKEHGVLQPVLLRAIDDRYEVIAGERRWRAAQMAGLTRIPALVREMEDKEVAEVSLIENLQRENLSVVEEALAYRNMLEEYNYTQELLAERIGKSRAHVANTMRLLGLPKEIMALIESKQISAGHARSLLSMESAEEQMRMAQEIVTGKWSVRKTEESIKRQKTKPVSGQAKSPELRDLEEYLQRHLGTRTEIQTKRRGGKISISYYDEDDLERILEILGVQQHV